MSGVVYTYVIFDALFSAFILPQAWRGGRLVTVGHVAVSVVWATGAWLLAPFITRLLGLQ